MDPIDLAVEAVEAQGEGEQLSFTKVAEQYNVSRHTLARRCKGTQASMQAKATNQQRLDPQQEQELIQHIERLTERGLSPTREMIRRFASGIAQEHVGKGWVTRFINKHHDKLVLR
jgi:transposase